MLRALCCRGPYRLPVNLFLCPQLRCCISDNFLMNLFSTAVPSPFAVLLMRIVFFANVGRSVLFKVLS